MRMHCVVSGACYKIYVTTYTNLRPKGQAIFRAQGDKLGRQLSTSKSYPSYFRPTKIKIISLRSSLLPFGEPSKIAPIFPLYLNPTGHSKFHYTSTPSACYGPRSDCLYSPVPGQCRRSSSSLPLFFHVPVTALRYNSLV